MKGYDTSNGCMGYVANVMGGRSFLLIGIEKGQSIFSTVLSDWLCNCKMLFFIKLLNMSVIFKLTIFKSLL